MDELYNLLVTERATLREVLMNIDCGNVPPANFPLNPKFYAQKLERIEGLLWLLEVEKRMCRKASEATDNAPETCNT